MKLTFTLIVCLFLAITSVRAQNRTYQNEAGFTHDNDGLLGQSSDRYYTAGDFFYFRNALKVNDTAQLYNKVLGFELGQKIFTPQVADVNASDTYYIDRPFAGYLYIAPSLNFLFKNESNLKLQVQVGMVGPASYARQAQEFIHNTLGFYKPHGWDYQIQNAFQFNLIANYNRLLIRGENIDLSLNTAASIGTGFTNATVGFMGRFGNFNYLFNSVSTTSTVSRRSDVKPLYNNEFFFFVKPYISGIAYNATIQGNLFESGNGPMEIKSDKDPVIIGSQLGADLVTNHWIFQLSGEVQSKETKQMVNSTHQWGSISVLYRFN